MRRCLFAGPSLSGWRPPAGIDLFEPAALGSVFRAVEAGYDTVALVDGVFGNVPAVWHKEILWALDRGVAVAGAASMGALRAAELRPYGMEGFGLAYRLYRRGVLTADAEVCLAHGDRSVGFVPLTEPMINVRVTLRRLVRRRRLAAADEARLLGPLARLHFSARSRPVVAEVAREELGRAAGDRLAHDFERYYVDAKRRDALALVAALERPRRPAPRRTSWSFPRTTNWIRQFEDEIDDVPPLPPARPSS